MNFKSANMIRTHLMKITNLHQGILSRATTTTSSIQESDKVDKVESIRMKQFHEKLKLQPLPRVGPAERFVELVLVETDSKGELIANTEKDPTKWGDWQNNGRVSDF